MKFSSIRKSIRGLFLERLEDDAFDIGGNSCDDLSRRMRRIVRMLLRDLGWSRTAEWDHAAQHLIENQTETVNVRRRLVRREGRDAEVEHFHYRRLIGALRDENIRRFEIAMNDAGFVCGGDCG